MVQIQYQDQFVITEEDLFKYLIYRDDVDSDTIKQNVTKFLRRIPHNIFTEGYHVLYDVLQQLSQHKIVLTYDFYQQILLNNMQEILENKNVTLYKDQTTIERQESLLNHFLTDFDLLSSIDITDESPLEAVMEFYIETWCKLKMEEIITNQLTIVREGLTIGRRRYMGVEDSNAYYNNAYRIIRSLRDGEGDLISQSIDTSRMTFEEINHMMQEVSTQPIVSKTGIQHIDTNYPFRKHEIVLIQAGTGVGKTRFANSMCYHSVYEGNNVLYLTFEQQSTRVQAMQEARHILQRYGFHSDITDKAIIERNYNFENQDIVIEGRRDFIENPNLGRIRIESINLHAKELESKLLDVWENGFHFDVVVIDYFGLIGTMGGGRYETLTDTINLLKSLVKSFKGQGFLLIILNQLTKDAEKEILKGTFESGKTDGSETQYLARGSDYIFTLVQTEEDKIVSRMRIFVDKVRLGRVVKHRVDALSYLGHCHFVDFEVSEEETDNQ